MLNSENKTYDKKILTIMLYRFSNDLFALKKSLILHIAIKAIKNIGYQALNEQSADSLYVVCIFEI